MVSLVKESFVLGKDAYKYLFRYCCYAALPLFLGCTIALAQVAVTTYHNDNYRSGANTQETTLTTSNVNETEFGRLLILPVQGYVYAQPLYVPGVTIGTTNHDLVFVATEHDQVYAFDANSGQQIWVDNLLVSSGGPFTVVSTVSSTDVECGDLVPEIGITGTPVIDLGTYTLYVVAKTKQYNKLTKTTSFYQTLYALDIRTGANVVPSHIITATAPGHGYGSSGGVLTFDPLRQGQRSALLLESGQVFVAWGSHCDVPIYHGYLMAFQETNLAPTGVFVSTPNGYQGGIWAGGGGPAADSSGAIYLTTGNGDFTGNFPNGTDYADSILRLNWSSSTHTFTLTDYFAPWDQLTLNRSDRDLGSGGALLLPDQPGTQYPHLLVQSGKEGTIDLVSRDNMGHWQSGMDTQIVQTLPFIIGDFYGAPAFWNDNLYFGGQQDHFKAFAFDPVAQQLSSNFTSQSIQRFNSPGPMSSISSDGTTNGIAWIIDPDDLSGDAVLHAYDANNLNTELYNSEESPGRDRAGHPVKFAVPTVANGKVFVGAQGQVAVYGLLGQ